MKRKNKVAVGISGGVDSAVAVALLKKQGFDVIAVHLYCWDEGPYCRSQEDREMAVRVAKHLDIPIVVWDLRKEYRDKVMGYFWREYKAGRTPNPDIVCNREIKFGIFMDRALKELGVDYIATGHYARLRREFPISNFQFPNKSEIRNKLEIRNPKLETIKGKDGNNQRGFIKLLRGVDETKDQSYFLYPLTQKQLEYILFPIGNYRKEEVRKMAKEFGLPNSERPDSQGICFVGNVPVSKFLREKLPVKIGPVVNTRGEIIGSHDGVWFYTEGQRHGFSAFAQGYGGQARLPLYVIGKDVASNTLIVGRGKESEVSALTVEDPHWINPNYRVEISGQDLFVRLRHLGDLVPATAHFSNLDGTLLIKLKRSERGVAPGQSAVFYRGEEVLGGGAIKEVKNLKLKIKNLERVKSVRVKKELLKISR